MPENSRDRAFSASWPHYSLALHKEVERLAQRPQANCVVISPSAITDKMSREETANHVLGK